MCFIVIVVCVIDKNMLTTPQSHGCIAGLTEQVMACYGIKSEWQLSSVLSKI